MIGITADGSRGYTGNIGGNSVSEFDLKSWTFVRSSRVPARSLRPST
ncbi:MAG: hypothetical protein IPP90_15855 [Gemmatimonadaceae bacterium]|nr:hypothetical protein [Gemmatimonadaceae bacterium]